ncbi:hypothetical protein EYF80_013694 [Liparis tanakae]|uniref:Uncharacterized protein n=1 Tax=Liparis tanakae TaxID=230148 RepID=A0A4Z2IG99_9TELE|nr:hypothetical protein EYF80_013694 [Liparis tanakae]
MLQEVHVEVVLTLNGFLYAQLEDVGEVAGDGAKPRAEQADATCAAAAFRLSGKQYRGKSRTTPPRASSAPLSPREADHSPGAARETPAGGTRGARRTGGHDDDGGNLHKDEAPQQKLPPPGDAARSANACSRPRNVSSSYGFCSLRAARCYTAAAAAEVETGTLQQQSPTERLMWTASLTPVGILTPAPFVTVPHIEIQSR